jgi:hypothetical protein
VLFARAPHEFARAVDVAGDVVHTQPLAGC